MGCTLVIGGSRGIGAATASLLAERGGEVAVGYLDRLDAATEVVKECRAFGRRSASFRADIGREEDVVAMSSRDRPALNR